MEDTSILQSLQEGDRKVYKQIFLTYYSPLCEYATRFIPDQDAEELVQGLMMFIWEHREDLVIENSLKSYLFTATRNRCLNAVKKQQYHQQIHTFLYEKLKDQFKDPDYYLVNELAENIEKAIRELPDTYRETFILSRFREQTHAQVAQTLGVSVKTVEYRITQSLRILRVKLKDYLPLILFLFQDLPFE
ncbi:MAG: RNA polymerase sigma-70 factor [Tannerellaceae bacterium]|nr:RNA polymerase sigma-70 factor [Tannerellaceae bacterium]